MPTLSQFTGVILFWDIRSHIKKLKTSSASRKMNVSICVASTDQCYNITHIAQHYPHIHLIIKLSPVRGKTVTLYLLISHSSPSILVWFRLHYLLSGSWQCEATSILFTRSGSPAWVFTHTHTNTFSQWQELSCQRTVVLIPRKLSERA